MSDELQTLCLHAGANSIFLGEMLLTASNAGPNHDHQLLDKLGMHLKGAPVVAR
jgi:biotin synthase